MTPPLALVYRGKATVPGCPEAAARLLAQSPHAFRIAYVGEREEERLTADVLARASLYVQPGGDELKPAWRRLRRHAPAIRAYVAGGGRYLGFCLGGYLAGHEPGFGLLEHDTDQYLATPGAEVHDERATVIEVLWGTRRRRLYFQDGCSFTPGPRTEVVATYRNGQAAAVVNPFGAGRVAAVGPHPEATDDWFRADDLPPVYPTTVDLGLDLIARVMRP